ncbi:MAG: phage tail sheath C-terminal domain-containing protein [Bacteroidota bacterium]
MNTYKTPGVYVEEISTFPPSVAEVSTAIPVFIGRTEKAGKDDMYTMKPIRISTLLDYASHFGSAQPANYDVTVTNGEITGIVKSTDGDPEFLMGHAVNHFYKNGGGACYVLSIGGYNTALPTGVTSETEAFSQAVDTIAKEDEPTLFVLADALRLGADDYVSVVQAALAQCDELKDRFVIVDVDASLTSEMFRTKMSSNYLKFGAAYTPYLETTLTHTFDEEQVSVSLDSGQAVKQGSYTIQTALKVAYNGFETKSLSVNVLGPLASNQTLPTFALVTSASEIVFTIHGVGTGKTAAELLTEWQKSGNDSLRGAGWDVSVESGKAGSSITSLSKTPLPTSNVANPSMKLAQLAETESGIYNAVKAALQRERVTLPPSPAMAGIYAAVDRDRGVWKAPANVAVSSVIGPTEKINTKVQDDLNVHTTGKSINAIRSFSGKGTLVWGARTLAGNDNEWRYISVRRLFNLIEESTQKATSFAVFEPNNATTWLKVKAMIDTYLTGLWERGALVGNTPDQAFFVNVGLGKTMTTDDILNGYMKVEIGIAAVRPAEFIVLKFSHKLQEA